jgi:two-component sensor histidine kinase
VIKVSQAVSGEIVLAKLLETLLRTGLAQAGAERGLLLLLRGAEPRIAADATTKGETVDVRLCDAPVTAATLPESVLHYVLRTRESVILDDASAENPFSTDPYILQQHTRSALCLPLLNQATLIGVLYLENNLAPHVFTPARISVLKLLASQAAISLENASLEEKKVLLKEVHHRVKNNLQLISSLLNLQAARVSDPAVSALFTDSRNRVRAMALVHENLFRAGNFARIPMSSHIQNLCTHLARSYEVHGRGVRLETQIDDVHLDVNRAVSCGLIINELVSNAVKHAFPNSRQGTVTVEFKLSADKRYVLTVRDDGIGLPPGFDPSRCESLGLQLVQDLSQQLHGTITAGSARPGTTFVLVFGADDDSRKDTYSRG